MMPFDMIRLYETMMSAGGPLLQSLLQKRQGLGKESASRMNERMGYASRFRPRGKLAWVHAASVGEAQSAIILIHALLLRDPALHVLVTTGTVTSATLLDKRLPPNAFHQFFPLDRPEWVRAFLDHWSPDLVLWMESELWPAMLHEVKTRRIPAALVNARLSARSFRRWSLAKKTSAAILSAFDIVLTQTETDRARFAALGAKDVRVTDNLKYSAAALPCDMDALASLQRQVEGRPVWLYASTHEGEESLAFRLHKNLEAALPGLLTVIVPRHPERRQALLETATEAGLKAKLRSLKPSIEAQDQVYIADTLGELGLFYRLCPVACIGRSFSRDGGGGHNPLEAAQLGCAPLHGPHVQNMTAIYDDMKAAGAVRSLASEADFELQLLRLLRDPAALNDLQQAALRFMTGKAHIVDTVMTALAPLIDHPHPHARDLRVCA